MRNPARTRVGWLSNVRALGALWLLGISVPVVAAEFPLTIQVENRGGARSFVDGTLEVQTSSRQPFVERVALRLPQPPGYLSLQPPDFELLATERFAQALQEGFLLPDENGKMRLFRPSRFRFEQPALFGWMDANGNLRDVGVFLRSVGEAQGAPHTEMFWSLDELRRQDAWQNLWAFDDARWNNFPQLIFNGNVRLADYPKTLTELQRLFAAPKSLDDIYFAYQAAKLLGIDTKQVKEALQVDTEPTRQMWANAMVILRDQFVRNWQAAKQRSVPAVLTSQLAQSLYQLRSHSSRLARLLEYFRQGRSASVKELKPLAEYLLGGAVGMEILLHKPGPYTDTEYCEALQKGYERAMGREAFKLLHDQMTIKTKRDKIRILQVEFGDPQSKYRLSAARQLAREVLGGESEVRQLCGKNSGELTDEDYVSALAAAYENVAQERRQLTMEETVILGDWESEYVPVLVTTNGVSSPGKIFVRGPEELPLGKDGYFSDRMSLVYNQNTPKGKRTVQLPLNRIQTVSELWVHHGLPSDRKVVWRSNDGDVYDAVFETISVDVQSPENVVMYFILTVQIGGHARYVIASPNEVFPSSCAGDLVARAKRAASH